MKRYLALILAIMLCTVCLFGCGAEKPAQTDALADTPIADEQTPTVEDGVEAPPEDVRDDETKDAGTETLRSLPWPRAESRYTDYEDFFGFVRNYYIGDYYVSEMESGLSWSYNGTRVKVVQKADCLSVVNKESRDLHIIDFPLDESVEWIAADSNWIYGVRGGMELFRMDYWGESETLFYDGVHRIETESGRVALAESVALFFAAVSEEGSMICRLFLPEMTLDVMAITDSPEVELEIPISNHAVIWWEPNPQFEELCAALIGDGTAYSGDDAKDRISLDYGIPIRYKHYASTQTGEHLVTEDHGAYVSECSYYAEDSAQYLSVYYCSSTVDFREYYVAPAGTEDWVLLKSSGEFCASGEDNPHGLGYKGYTAIRYVAECDSTVSDIWRMKGVCVGLDGSGTCEEDVPDRYWEDIQLVNGTFMMSWRWSEEEGSYCVIGEADLCEDCPDFWPNHYREPREQDAASKLTAEELQWFNEEFFNRWRAENGGTFFDSMPNMFLTSTYENVTEIDPLLLFYDGDGVTEQDITQTELGRLEELGCMTQLDVNKLSRAGMDTVLNEYADIGVNSLAADLFETPGLTYLEENDAWYHFHGDTNWSRYEMTAGYWNDDGTVDLYYENALLSYTNETSRFKVTLFNVDGRYCFLSNLPA